MFTLLICDIIWVSWQRVAEKSTLYCWLNGGVMEEKIRNLIEGEVLKLGVSIDSVEYVKEVMEGNNGI